MRGDGSKAKKAEHANAVSTCDADITFAISTWLRAGIICFSLYHISYISLRSVDSAYRSTFDQSTSAVSAKFKRTFGTKACCDKFAAFSLYLLFMKGHDLSFYVSCSQNKPYILFKMTRNGN